MENTEKSKIGVGNGGRELVVVTTHVGDLRNRETREISAKRLTKMKIDISTIQETHWVDNGEWGEGDILFT